LVFVIKGSLSNSSWRSLCVSVCLWAFMLKS
jgi:hypothetical protein